MFGKQNINRNLSQFRSVGKKKWNQTIMTQSDVSQKEKSDYQIILSILDVDLS